MWWVEIIVLVFEICIGVKMVKIKECYFGVNKVVWCNNCLEIFAKGEVNKRDFWSGKVKEDEGVNVGPKCNFWVLNCKFLETRLYIFPVFCLLILF